MQKGVLAFSVSVVWMNVNLVMGKYFDSIIEVEGCLIYFFFPNASRTNLCVFNF
jgi:hypothetical protein